MIVTLSDRQMLGKWRRGALLEPALTECSVERFDGLEVDGVLSQAMRTWYLGLLREGDPSQLKVTEISKRLAFKKEGSGIWAVEHPSDVVRILDMVIDGETTPLRVLDASRDSDRAAIAALANRYNRAGAFTAVIGRDGRWLLTGDSQTEPDVAVCRAIVDPGDETYILDEQMLEQIPAKAREALETENI